VKGEVIVGTGIIRESVVRNQHVILALLMRSKRNPRRRRPGERRLNSSDSRLEKRKKPIESEQRRLGQRKRPDDVKRSWIGRGL
jgi:hypothetical protein